MIQLFGQSRDGQVTQKGVLLLLTFWLNLVLLPCAMAVVSTAAIWIDGPTYASRSGIISLSRFMIMSFKSSFRFLSRRMRS
jgi:hypothetical protein